MKKNLTTMSVNHVIITVFVLTFALVGSLVYMAQKTISSALEDSSELVKKQYQKQHHLMNMNMAGFNRIIALETILLAGDAFVQDEYLMAFHRNERLYSKHQSLLKQAIGSNQLEAEMLKELSNLGLSVGPVQNEIAEKAMNDQQQEAISMLLSGTLGDTRKFYEKVNAFSLYQDTEIQNSIQSASSRVNGLMNNFTVIAAILIILSMVYSVFIANKFTRVNKQLRNSNDNLEQTVQQRTTELLKVQEELIQQNRQLEELSITDPLTKICNRLKIEQCLAERHELFSATSQLYSILLIDLDNFKTINDTHGHQVGDSVLQAFAEQLKFFFTENYPIGRWGGEEFIVVLNDCDIDHAQQLAEDFRAKVAETNLPVIGKLTLSGGIATVQSGETINDVLQRSDDALYKAKREGRNLVSASS